MPPERPEPEQPEPERPEPEQPAQDQEPKQRRGLSPGLLLMAIVALAITIAAAVKNMK